MDYPRHLPKNVNFSPTLILNPEAALMDDIENLPNAAFVVAVMICETERS